jgi:hypothetical protein
MFPPNHSSSFRIPKQSVLLLDIKKFKFSTRKMMTDMVMARERKGEEFYGGVAIIEC